MKIKYLTIIAITTIFLAFGCTKQRCISCIAERPRGEVIKHVMQCDKDLDYLYGYEDGLKKYYKENGDTINVKCLYSY